MIEQKEVYKLIDEYWKKQNIKLKTYQKQIERANKIGDNACVIAYAKMSTERIFAQNILTELKIRIEQSIRNKKEVK